MSIKKRTQNEGDIGNKIKDGKKVEKLISQEGIQGARKIAGLEGHDEEGNYYMPGHDKPGCKCNEIFFKKKEE